MGKVRFSYFPRFFAGFLVFSGLVGNKQITNEVYVNLVSEMMYPKAEFGPYGYSPEENRVSACRCLLLPAFFTFLFPLRRRQRKVEQQFSLEVMLLFVPKLVL
jgi:hypothetical protein